MSKRGAYIRVDRGIGVSRGHVVFGEHAVYVFFNKNSEAMPAIHEAYALHLLGVHIHQRLCLSQNMRRVDVGAPIIVVSPFTILLMDRMATTGRVDYDTELQRHHEVLRRAWDIGPGDRVLDVGCGAGQTTREAAHLAKAGSVLGVDISAPMIYDGRGSLPGRKGLAMRVSCSGDAAVHPFQPQAFDVVISRFGTMFFAEPVSCLRQSCALAAAGRAPDDDRGRRSRPMNGRWRSAARLRPLRLPLRRCPVAFSFGDPDDRANARRCGLRRQSRVGDVGRSVYYGADSVPRRSTGWADFRRPGRHCRRWRRPSRNARWLRLRETSCDARYRARRVAWLACMACHRPPGVIGYGASFTRRQPHLIAVS